MMTKKPQRTNDKTLAAIEAELRRNGHAYPFAWMVGFLVDNNIALKDALTRTGKQEVVKQLGRLVYEIKTGEIAE